MPEHNPGQMGGTMRLGKRRTIFKSKTSVMSVYLRVDCLFLRSGLVLFFCFLSMIISLFQENCTEMWTILKRGTDTDLRLVVLFISVQRSQINLKCSKLKTLMCCHCRWTLCWRTALKKMVFDLWARMSTEKEWRSLNWKVSKRLNVHVTEWWQRCACWPFKLPLSLLISLFLLFQVIVTLSECSITQSSPQGQSNLLLHTLDSCWLLQESSRVTFPRAVSSLLGKFSLSAGLVKHHEVRNTISRT